MMAHLTSIKLDAGPLKSRLAASSYPLLDARQAIGILQDALHPAHHLQATEAVRSPSGRSAMLGYSASSRRTGAPCDPAKAIKCSNAVAVEIERKNRISSPYCSGTSNLSCS